MVLESLYHRQDLMFRSSLINVVVSAITFSLLRFSKWVNNIFLITFSPFTVHNYFPVFIQRVIINIHPMTVKPIFRVNEMSPKRTVKTIEIAIFVNVVRCTVIIANWHLTIFTEVFYDGFFYILHSFA
nr:MAG TPA: hypothetical protein [Caudoviricetes sp.]